MDVKSITRNVGYALLVSALFMFLSIIVSVMDGNDSALAALLISFLITFTVGFFPFIFVRKSNKITLREGYVTIVLSWMLSFIFGMLPYALWGGPFTLANAWFESVSGFTTSGATILENVEALPRSLLFWRSSTHFIGGLGVVVFLLLIIPSSSPIRMRLTNMELSSLSKGSYSVRTNKTVFVFTYVYLGIAAAAFIAYCLAGMSPFDAICHAFSVCATGGFSSRNLSIGAFDSRLIEGITMVFMLLSATHFGLIYMSIINRSLKPLNNPVLKFYLLSVLTVAICSGLSIRYTTGAPVGESLWNGAFHTIAMSTTTGFAICDDSSWTLLPRLLPLVIGFMCGCAGSTSGGVKADRILVLFKVIVTQIRRTLHPTSVNEVKVGSRVLDDHFVSQQMLYILLYGLLILLSTIISLIIGVPDLESFTASLASISNLGPCTGAMGTFGNYNMIPASAKLLYTVDMFLGRVEIYPVIAVLAMVFNRRRH